MLNPHTISRSSSHYLALARPVFWQSLKIKAAGFWSLDMGARGCNKIIFEWIGQNFGTLAEL